MGLFADRQSLQMASIAGHVPTLHQCINSMKCINDACTWRNDAANAFPVAIYASRTLTNFLFTGSLTFLLAMDIT